MSGGHVHRLERLWEVTRSLGAFQELEPFLQTSLSAAIELTESEVAFVFELEEGGEAFHVLGAPRHHQDALRNLRLPVRESAAGQVYRSLQPLRLTHKEMGAHFYKEAAVGLPEVQTLAAVPLVLRGKPLGVLEALNKNKADYTEDDLLFLEALAVLMALAIHSEALQRRAEAAMTELAELDRLKSDFVAITSHELRTPLGLILGHATFLREMLDGEARQQAETIVRYASRLKEIIESLARIHNYESGTARLRKSRFSISHLIDTILASFADLAAQRNVSLQTERRSGDLFIEGDPAKISIALGNLVKNALLFTKEGGHVMVISEAVPGYVKVSVVDDGIGIPAKDLPRVFERFFQVEAPLTRRHGGMGLGLSVAKAMIELHGGRIWAESQVGKGSIFSFLLPAPFPSTSSV